MILQDWTIDLLVKATAMLTLALVADRALRQSSAASKRKRCPPSRGPVVQR